MRILYCAIDQTVPGTTGGSVHVAGVTGGLARLGHEVYALATPGRGPLPATGVTWMAMSPPLGSQHLRWLRSPDVTEIAQRLQPDVIIERYHNFGGEGIAAANEIGALPVLEVNAPVIDYPGSPKAAIDKALLIQPMRRWREHLCMDAALIVTPTAKILPADTPPAKVIEVEWGADTDRFRPDASGTLRFQRPAGTLAVFAGAFRSWHGAVHLVRAVRQLRQSGRTDISAVFIGNGPELPKVRTEAEGVPGIVFTGALPHDDMPAQLAAADIGVAPFDTAAHQPLSLGFYWSPLKIFEYMASGLPVVAPAVDRIPQLVRDHVEGVLYQPSDQDALAHALERLTDRSVREPLGQAARARAVADFSWAAHCRQLESAISAALAHPSHTG